MLAKRLIHGLSLSMDSEEAMINKLKVRPKCVSVWPVILHSGDSKNKVRSVERLSCDNNYPLTLSFVLCLHSSSVITPEQLQKLRALSDETVHTASLFLSPFFKKNKFFVSHTVFRFAASMWLRVHEQTAQNVHRHERQCRPQQQVQQLH